jgi:hypothetical protein
MNPKLGTGVKRKIPFFFLTEQRPLLARKMKKYDT